MSNTNIMNNNLQKLLSAFIIIIFCFPGIRSQQVLTESGIKADEFMVSDNTISIHVGDMYGGGVVAWVDESGMHGLILSAIELSTEQVWSNVERDINDPSRWKFDGKANSEAIITQPGHLDSAAKLCLDYVNEDYGTGVFSDWYLPAIQELKSFLPNYMDIHFALINDNNPATTPPKVPIWSSTEGITFTARLFSLNLDDGNDYEVNKYRKMGVRAVRAF
ncbi:MAG TPA: hypothetical protein DCQ58_10525 [Saprospirales bacterium]|nr:hypothetical protein [Saprospirales bacterium]